MILLFYSTMFQGEVKLVGCIFGDNGGSGKGKEGKGKGKLPSGKATSEE